MHIPPPAAWVRSSLSGLARVFTLLLLMAAAVSGQDSGIRSRQWIVQLADLLGDTREEQLAVAEQRFAAAQMAERGINIVDHLGRSGVLLVRSADEETEADLEAKLALVEGFVAAEPFNPRASNSGQIPVDVGPGYRRGAPGAITPLPDGTEYPHYESSIGYDGIANTGFRPPDPSGAAGPTVYVQGVNTQFTISNKATGATIASASATTFFAPLGGLLSFSDPVVVFNEHTQRFAVGIIDFNTTTLSRFDLAISKTANPTTFTAADWNFFRYNADDTSAGFDFADYPKMGYNADGYVVSFNQFKNASSYDHVSVLAIRNDGTSPGGTVVVPGGFNNFTLAPASSHDNPVGVDDPFWFVQTGTSTTVIQAIQMTNPFAVSPTFTFNNLTVNAYFGPQSPHQPGGQLTGNSNLGDRFYFTGMRTISGVTHLVATHTSAKTSGNAFSEVRWYDLNITGVPSVIQQGKIDAGANIDTYFPDIDIAADGAIGLGYMQSGSGAGQFISGYVTGRTPSDLPGTMQTPVVAKLGTANLTPADRIGDYADVSVDPVDGSFWYTFEYVGGTGAQAWSTWVHNFSVAPTFTVTSTGPAIGSIVGIGPTSYTVNFNAAYILGSVSAADFTVNGTPASSFSVVDADTLTFTFAISPAVEGLNTMAIAAGAITGNVSLPVNAFTGQFLLDTVPLAITGISPASGSVLLPGPGTQTFRVSFNEPVAPGTVQTADFVFNQGTVVSATPVGPGNAAVDVVVSGLVTEGALTLTIGTSAFTDVNGGPNPVGFAASYALDYVTRPFPAPLTARLPAGSLIYDGSSSGAVNPAGDTDTFALAVDPGQTVTVKVTPTSVGLRPSVQLLDPSSTVIGSGTAAAANQNALLQTVPATAAGTYSIDVSGAGGTIGNYTVQVTLNAALENEGTITGVTNSTLGTAENINSTFVALQPGIPGAQRGAVLGASDTTSYAAAAVTPTFLDISTTGTISTATGDDASETLSGAQLAGFAFPLYGTNFTSIAFSTNGLITFPAGDTAFSNTDLSTSPSQAAIAVLWDDLENLNTGTGTGSSRIYWQVIGSGPSQQLIVQWNNVRKLNGSLLFTCQAVLSANGNIQINYGSGVTTAAVVSSATVGIKAAGTASPQRTLVSFNQSQGSLVGPTLSTLITPPSAGVDYYAFSLNTGETATVAVTGQSAGTLDLELRSSGDATLATGVAGPTNLTSVISNFTAPTTGTYFARISSTVSVPYSLVVTKNAAFDTEDNNTGPTAQSLGGSLLALGYLESGPLAPEGFETGNFSQFPWVTTGNANWLVTNTAAAAGTFSARSGVITHSQSSTLSVTLTTGAGNISFARRVSSESGFDSLRFSIDGVLQGSWSGIETSFTTVTFPVATAGSHTFTWAYTKDSSASIGLDAAFVDNIIFPIVVGVGQDWYSFNVASTGAPLVLTTTTPGDGPGEFVNSLNPHLELYDPSNTLVASGVAQADGRNERLQHTSLTTGTYRVRVIGEAGTTGEYLLGVGVAPVVTLNPSSQVVTVGNLASFNAAATGVPAPTVQWQVSTDGGANFSNIGGATSVTLIFATVIGDNGKQYRAVFSNASGSATTTSATLTVLTPLEAWRQLYFGSSANSGPGANGADPNNNGLNNLLEYALGGNPTVNNGLSLLPQIGVSAGNRLQLIYPRFASNTDLTLTVQAADSAAGPYTNLARSIGGVPTAVVAPGSTATETGTGNPFTVTVTDLYQVNDPAHPTRFMRLCVSDGVNTFYTDPCGDFTLTIKGTANLAPSQFTFLGLAMTRKPEYQGVAETVSGATLTSSAATWTTNQFASTPAPGYFLEVYSGAKKGLLTQVVSCDGTARTLTVLENLTTLGVESTNVTFRIRQNWSLAGLFGATNSAGFGAGNSATADLVQIYNPSLGGGAGGYDQYFYSTAEQGTGWRKVGGGTADAANDPIAQDEGLIIQRRQSSNLAINLAASVKLGATLTTVFPGPNFIGNVYPSGVMTLGLTDATANPPKYSSGLYTGNITTGVKGGTSTTADLILIYNPALGGGAGGYDQYFYSTGGLPGIGWRKIGGGNTNQAGTVLATGKSIYLKRFSTAGSFNWVMPQPFPNP